MNPYTQFFESIWKVLSGMFAIIMVIFFILFQIALWVIGVFVSVVIIKIVASFFGIYF
jgi:hypothetical protein